jgi:hypothetical protein
MNVWKTSQIIAPKPLTIKTYTCSDYYKLSSNSLNFGIVGLGPKGFYALASLQKALQDSQTIKPAQLHIFNSHRFFAAGPNYSPDQPEFLLVNYAIEHISAWTEAELEDPEKLTFLEWIETYASTKISPKAGDFASRALVGIYLQDALKIVLKRLPKNISVIAFKGEVTGCQIDHDAKVKLELDNIAFHPEVNYSSVILTTGHSFPSSIPKGLECNPYFVNKVYPTHSWVQSITNQDRVAIDGLGLTFVDAILALTEGKGGQFEEKNGQMTYLASGNEPKEIYAFSRSGLPMIPRPGISPQNQEELEFFNSKVEKRLKRLHGKIDFERDILPLIKLEMEVKWHQTLVKRGFRPGEWFGIFNFEKFLNPLPDKCFSFGDSYQTQMEKLIKSYVDELEDPDKSPILQVASVWRRLLPMITDCYNFEGFTTESKIHFEKFYLGKFNQISFGPPAISMRKICTLIKQGSLKFTLGRSPTIESIQNHKFFISSAENGSSTVCDYLIQARIPKNQFPHRNSSLFEDLYKRGLASCNNQEQPSNCPKIDTKGQLISISGITIPQITLYGTPTEGMTLDNDSLSRNRNDFGSHWSAQTVKKLEIESEKNYEYANKKPIPAKNYSTYQTLDQKDFA